jgi:hypothetical protein
VTVTVAPSGAVLGLQLSPLAMRRSHTQLQQEILAVFRQATQQAATALEQTVQPMLGARMEQFKEAFAAHAGSVQPLGPSTPPPATSLPMPALPAARPETAPPTRLETSESAPDSGDRSVLAKGSASAKGLPKQARTSPTSSPTARRATAPTGRANP